MNDASAPRFDLETRLSEPSSVERPNRRRSSLPDTILTAFHAACDLRDFTVAGRLLKTFEAVITAPGDRPGFDRRRALAQLVAGHERLWSLRHH